MFSWFRLEKIVSKLGAKNKRHKRRKRPSTVDLFVESLETRLVPAPFTPTFSNLSSPSISYGTAPTTISGTLNPNSGGENVPSGETVDITLNGVTQPALLDGSDNFSTTFDTSTLAVAVLPYSIGFSYPGDADFDTAADSSSLTVTPYVLSYTIGNDSQTYGTPADFAGDLGTTIAGVNGETLGISYSSDGDTATAAVGTYAITGTVSDGTGAASNYSVTLSSGTLTVNQYALSYTIGDDSQTYGTPADFASDLGTTIAPG